MALSPAECKHHEHMCRAVCMSRIVCALPSDTTSHGMPADILLRLPCCCRSDLLLAVVLVGADVVLSVGYVIM
jgi:hypothetical protein